MAVECAATGTRTLASRPHLCRVDGFTIFASFKHLDVFDFHKRHFERIAIAAAESVPLASELL